MANPVKKFSFNEKLQETVTIEATALRKIQIATIPEGFEVLSVLERQSKSGNTYYSHVIGNLKEGKEYRNVGSHTKYAVGTKMHEHTMSVSERTGNDNKVYQNLWLND